MAYHRPAKFTQWMNRAIAWIAAIGLTPSDTVMLEVKGRKSGQVRANSVTSVDVDGTRYLVSVRGESEWVRNVRAANGEAAIRHRGRRRVRLQELPVEQRAPVLQAYFRKTWRATSAYFGGLKKDASLAEFARVAPEHTVFRVTDQSYAPGSHVRHD